MRFFCCLELVRNFHDETEKKYHQALSTCLANSKDWDGKRNCRRPAGNVVPLCK